MKKMMMVTMVMTMTVISTSAAICNWGLASRMQFDGAYQGGALCQLYVVTGYDEESGAVLSELFDTRYTVTTPNTQRGNLGAQAGDQPFSYGNTFYGVTLNESTEVYMVVFNEAGTYYQQSSIATLGDYGFSSTQPANGVLFAFSWGSTLLYDENDPTQIIGGLGGWVPVPEPTAMALVALGMAVVGLRRRFRK